MCYLTYKAAVTLRIAGIFKDMLLLINYISALALLPMMSVVKLCKVGVVAVTAVILGKGFYTHHCF